MVQAALQPLRILKYPHHPGELPNWIAAFSLPAYQQYGESTFAPSTASAAPGPPKAGILHGRFCCPEP